MSWLCCGVVVVVVLLCPLCLLTESRGSSGPGRATQYRAEPESTIVRAGWTRSRSKEITCSRSWRSAVLSSGTLRGIDDVYGGGTSGFEILGEGGRKEEREREGVGGGRH